MIEITRFRLADGADEAGFLVADARLQSEFAYQQAGLMRRTTARSGDGEWVVIDIWRSAADAEACDGRWDSDPVVQEFRSYIEAGSLRSDRYLELGG
ncbi:MAG TPA: hypothetical protein VFN68_01700 [Acidimicrobiales bacterium]|nr:hypothetical protein [Acidimicrobiales bacterium]